MKNEEWRPVPGYETSYEVSTHGQVRGLPRTVATCYGGRRSQAGTRLRLRLDRCGYVRAKLLKGGCGKNWLVHRLVAMAFLPNPSGRPHINHIDGDRANNEVWNLEWCTAAENNRHSAGRISGAAPKGVMNGAASLIRQFSPESGEVVAEHVTMSDAARSVGCPLGTLSGAISRGLRCRGFIWKRVGKTRRLCAALGIPLTETRQ